jgi:hypothetical protein
MACVGRWCEVDGGGQPGGGDEADSHRPDRFDQAFAGLRYRSDRGDGRRQPDQTAPHVEGHFHSLIGRRAMTHGAATSGTDLERRPNARYLHADLWSNDRGAG